MATVRVVLSAISYHLSRAPPLSLSLYLCCAVAAVCPVQVQQHLFFLSAASRASAHSGSSDWSQPGRTQRVRIRPCQSLSARREVFSYREVEQWSSRAVWRGSCCSCMSCLGIQIDIYFPGSASNISHKRNKHFKIIYNLKFISNQNIAANCRAIKP